MTTSTAPTAPTVTVARYGLARPELEDARVTLARVAPGRLEQVWAEVLHDAEALTPGTPTLRDVIDAMRLHPDPLVALAASGLEVRLRSFEALAGQGLALHH